MIDILRESALQAAIGTTGAMVAFILFGVIRRVL